jgi:hypothetical protein
MKRVYIIITSIFIIAIFLALSWKFNLLSLSQKENNTLKNETSKNGILSKKHPLLRQNNVINPLKSISLVVFKQEKKVIFFVTDSMSKSYILQRESIKLSSETNGPRLYNTDINIPEGVYKIKNSSLKPTPYILLNFPNDFDVNKQKADKRPILNSKITLGLRDNNIILDSLLLQNFLLFKEMVSPKNAQIIILPNDLRHGERIPFCLTCPTWIEELYGNLRITLLDLQ